MAHDHHTHHHNVNHSKVFAIGIILNIAFVIIEVIYGFSANSSALLADAGHNFSDVLSLVFSWLAAWMALRTPKGKYTYGLKKTTILASLLNALMLFVAVGFIIWDAVEKLLVPEHVKGITIMMVAAAGIVVNGITALLFMKGQKDDLNIKGAFLHMLADAAVSAGVVIAALVIYFTGYMVIDPVISLVIVVIIVWGTIRLFLESIDLVLDAVPKNIDIDEVRLYLAQVEGVNDVHDLHIWAMSTTQNALTAHLVAPKADATEILMKVKAGLKKQFGIKHTTLQIEEKFAEATCDDCGG